MMSDQPAQRELRSILRSTRVGDLKLTPCPILSPNATVAEAAVAMRRQSHGSAMVCTAGKVVGIFTERDLMRVVASGKGLEVPLSQVMTANPKNRDRGGNALRGRPFHGSGRVPSAAGRGLDRTTVGNRRCEGFGSLPRRTLSGRDLQPGLTRAVDCQRSRGSVVPGNQPTSPPNPTNPT